MTDISAYSAREGLWDTLVRSRAYLVATVALGIAFAFALFPQLFASHSPIAGDITARLKPPSSTYFFGTDELGRDVYSRFVYGARLSMFSACLAVFIGFAVGSLIGGAAGAVGGRVDAVVMRIVDVLLSIPTLLMAITIIAVLGFGTVNIAIAVGLSNVAMVARVMRSRVISVRSELYVTIAALSGVGPIRRLSRHIFPNSVGAALALAIIELGSAVISVASLSFLGFGANPPNPEWGSVIANGQPYLIDAWWISTLPGICICVLMISLNSLSRTLATSRASAW